MPLFGKKPRVQPIWDSSRCLPMDVKQWWDDVARRARPGFPDDGRYFVAFFVNRNEHPCFVFEGPATREEAQWFLRDFARQYRTKPHRLTEMHFDYLDGVWGARRQGLPFGSLIIIDPRYSDMAHEAMEFPDELQAHGLLGAAAARRNPEAFFTEDWNFRLPPDREVVSIERYGELLDAALSRASPLLNLDPAGLDDLQSAAQAVADRQPNTPILEILDTAALNYLARRLQQATVEGRWTAAVFSLGDRDLVQRLDVEKESCDQEANTRLTVLQVAVRIIFSQAPAYFERLGLQDSTLTYLYLDDVVDDRFAMQRKTGQGGTLRPHDV